MLCATRTGDRDPALCVRVRDRCALQHWNAACDGVRTNANEKHCAWHPAGRLVGRLCRCRAAVRLANPGIRLAGTICCAILPGVVTLCILRNAPDLPSWSTASRVARCRGGTFGTIWTVPPVRRMFLLWTLTSIALQFVITARTMGSQLSRQRHGARHPRRGLGRCRDVHPGDSGKVATGYLADRMGRRITWVVSGVLTALYLPVLIYAVTPTNLAFLLLLFGLLYAAPLRLTRPT